MSPDVGVGLLRPILGKGGQRPPRPEHGESDQRIGSMKAPGVPGVNQELKPECGLGPFHLWI